MFIRLLKLFLFIVIFPAYSLVPLKNLMLGDEVQFSENDRGPFSTVDKFNSYLSEKTDFSKKFKFYERTIQLRNYCQSGTSLRYVNESERKSALKSFIASFRYFGLKKSIEDIGNSLNALEVEKSVKKTFSQNLVNNFCSQNLTVISKKQLAIFMGSSFSALDKSKLSKRSTLFSDSIVRSKNLLRGVRSFRNFCSWSGDPEVFDLLETYLYSPMFVQRGIDFFFNQNTSLNGDIVGCENNICRKLSDDLGLSFPLSVASDSIESDFKDIYCEYFFDKKVTSKKSGTTVSGWKANESGEELVRDLFYFLSITGIIDNTFNNVTSSEDLLYVLDSSIDTYFNTWSDSQLSSSENYLTFEEGFNLSLTHGKNKRGRTLTLNINSGEIDKIFSDSDYLRLKANLNFSKKFLSWWIRTKFETLPSNTKKLNHLKKVLKMELDEILPSLLSKVPTYKLEKARFHKMFFKYFYNHFSNLSKTKLDIDDLVSYEISLKFAPSALQKIYKIKKFQDLTEDKKEPY